MSKVFTRHLTTPDAWRGSDIADPRRWTLRVTTDDIEELMTAVGVATSRGLGLTEITADDFPLDGFRATIDRMVHELQHGLGFVVLSGLPLHERLDAEQARVIFWGIGQHMGVPVPQNDRGHLLGDVIDLGTAGVSVDPNRRPYEGASPFRLHSDYGDTVGLMCLQPAKEGGESFLASMIETHNIMLAERPDLLELLYEDFAVDAKGEELPGELPYYWCPVFGVESGVVSAIDVSWFVYDAQRFEELPRLTTAQIEAFELMESVRLRPDMAVSMMLQPGDIQFQNNFVTVHGRTAWVEHDEVEKRRHLLRLWINHADARPLVPRMAERRAGIPQRATA